MLIPKVAIGVPYYRTVEGPTLLSCMGLCARSARSVAMLPISCSGAYVEQNRNGIVRYALQTGIPFDYLLFVDTDMQFPDDALLRLLAHEKAIVGANYRVRTAPFKHAAHYLDGTDLHLMEPGLHPMAHVPTGLMLVNFDIFREIAPPWFVAPTNEDDPRDDVYFCNLVRAHGYEVWCDHDLTREVRHRTVQDLTWFDQGQIVVQGAELNREEGETDAARRAAVSRENWDTSERRGQARAEGVVEPLAQEVSHEQRVA